jgi:hypothetical protein
MMRDEEKYNISHALSWQLALLSTAHVTTGKSLTNKEN